MFYDEKSNIDIYKRIDDLEANLNERPDLTLMDTRKMCENALEYLYLRFFGQEFTGNFDELLRNNRFRSRVENDDLFKNVNSIVRIYGNDAAHNMRPQTNTDPKMRADLAITTLAHVLRIVYEITCNINSETYGIPQADVALENDEGQKLKNNPDLSEAINNSEKSVSIDNALDNDNISNPEDIATNNEQITGQVILKIERKMQGDRPQKYIIVELKNSNINIGDRENKFEWIIGEDAYPGGVSRRKWKKTFYGKQIICKITREDMGGSIENTTPLYIENNIQQPLNQPEQPVSKSKKNKKSDDSKKVNENKKVNIKETNNAKTDKETNKNNDVKDKNNSDSVSLLNDAKKINAKNNDEQELVKSNKIEKEKSSLSENNPKKDKNNELQFPYEMKHVPDMDTSVFFTNASLVDYFIRPNDNFVLNSLEIVSPDVYLYRLLKQSHFEKVYFVEVEGTNCEIYSYDEFSADAFAFERKKTVRKGLSGLTTLAKKSEEAKSIDDTKNYQRKYGKRKIRNFSSDAEFKMQFATAIRNALEDKKQKTAVVMPLRIFERKGYCDDAVIDTLGNIAKHNDTENALIITLQNRSDILECMNSDNTNIHDWVNIVQDEAGTTNNERRAKAINYLVSHGRILIAEEYGVDEIANLILRKILIENDPILSAIDINKVYPLAEHLKQFFINQSKEFNTLRNFNGNIIKELCNQLKMDSVKKELVNKSEEYKPAKNGYSDKLNPLQLERVYHTRYDHYENESSLSEVLQKFDKLIGSEMQHVKDQILESIAVFKDGKQSIQTMIANGRTPDEDDLPYMNMIFEGGPGTGKTTVAKLTAKLLMAVGILPSDKYVYITATELVEGIVGETEEKIREAAERAKGGVLFIDEFQGFDHGHSNGNMAQDAMGAIVSLINKHRDDLCIIVAGYKEGVEKVLGFDVGSHRRFPNTIEFKDYSVDTLMAILDLRLKYFGKQIEEDAIPCIKKVIEFEKKKAKGMFGNGGFIKDDLIPRLDRKRIVRHDNNGIYIKQDVLDAYPEVFDIEGPNKDSMELKTCISVMKNDRIPYELKQRNHIEVSKLTDKAVIYLSTDKGQGTGFLIHKDGYALTCYHVIRDVKEINARVRIQGRLGGDDSFHKCTVVKIDEKLDLALVKLDGKNFPYLPLAKKNRKIIKGEEFILSGYPFGKKTQEGLTTFKGTVASDGDHADNAGFIYYLIDGEAKAGNSGSPIIALSDGLVIGILRGSIDERSTSTKTEEINYMRPAYYFWTDFLEDKH